MTLSEVESEETWNGRWSNWGGALDVIASHPVLGVGAGNYAEATMEYSESVVRHTLVKGRSQVLLITYS
jgi:O-antigen ligase